MQGRRIQKVGPSTLTVSLPSSWSKEAGLRKGDLVFFTPQSDGSLKLRVRESNKQEKKANEFVVNSDLCDQEGLLERIIVGNYLLGHDIISIVSSKRILNSHSEEIRRISRKLIGLGIIEETPIRIILQCSIDASKFPIYMVVRRLYAIASTIHKEAMQALSEMRVELAEEAIRREEDADMMYWLASRLLYSAQYNRDISEKIDLNRRNILNLIMLVGFLERMADWGEKIGKNVILIEKKGVGIGKPLIEGVYQLSEQAYAICVNAMESVFTGDIKLANTAIENYKKEIEREEEKLVQDLPLRLPDSEMASNLRHILWGIRRIAELGAEIAELSLNQALDSSTKLCKSLDNSYIKNK